MTLRLYLKGPNLIGSENPSYIILYLPITCVSGWIFRGLRLSIGLELFLNLTIISWIVQWFLHAYGFLKGQDVIKTSTVVPTVHDMPLVFNWIFYSTPLVCNCARFLSTSFLIRCEGCEFDSKSYAEGDVFTAAHDPCLSCTCSVSR